MNEIWVDVKGYEGIYQVSNLGNIKRLVGYRAKKERLLVKNKHKEYFMVTLSKNAVHDRRLVHKIVAEHFIPNPFNKPKLNHVDFDSFNNKADNLEWCTQKENVNHSISMGRMNRKGEKSHKHKLTNEDVIGIRKMREAGVHRDVIAKKYNITSHYAYIVATKRTWKHI